MKRILLALGVIASLNFAGVVYAEATVPSDYNQDVTAGQNQLASDQNAQIQAKEVKDGENLEGQVDDGQVQVDEEVGQQEGEMGASVSGETTHGEAQSGSEEQSINGSDAAGTTQTDGGENQ